jgi:hypothetical protein
MHAYNTLGEAGVLAFAETNLPTLMYNDGHQTQTIKMADWEKYRMNVCGGRAGGGQGGAGGQQPVRQGHAPTRLHLFHRTSSTVAYE